MKSLKKILLFSFLFLSLAFAASVYAFSDKIYQSLEQFSKILHYVEENYVDEVDESKLILGAIKGMLATLDPHTFYLSPDFYKELRADTAGKFGGVGLEVSIKEDVLTIVSPMEGSPADRAGIQPGDKIIRIDGKLTHDMNLVDAVKNMRGSNKTKVVLTLFREGWKSTRDFTLTREIINVKSVKAELLEQKYLYAKINTFQERTAQDLQKAIEVNQKKSGGLQGLIIDLRNNPGGLLDEAVSVSDLFVKEGVLVSVKGRVGKPEDRKATGKAPYADLPMVVLVNAGSASASEIFAGAMQDYGRAFVMGTKSFGKGSVQTVMELGNGAGLKLTIARYYTPKGRKIDGKGVLPDEIVALPKTENKKAEEDEILPAAKEDSQKQAALRHLKQMEQK
ncbi:MAG: S41 family peptidase [Deltaproteobacteria bacterium]|nr:S41 family peptidase [Deltaproteobacteria bacterium]